MPNYMTPKCPTSPRDWAWQAETVTQVHLASGQVLTFRGAPLITEQCTEIDNLIAELDCERMNHALNRFKAEFPDHHVTISAGVFHVL